MDAQITIGTVISGTLNETDLLTAFATELSRVSHASPSNEILRLEAYTEAQSPTENAQEVIIDLMDALTEYAPAHMYFGSIEGDGADFGWWAEDIELADCEIVKLDDENVIDVDCQVHVNVNDHGNVTVSELRGAEIWSAV